MVQNIPMILVTSPLLEPTNPAMPSIILTREVTELDTGEEENYLYPDSLFLAARSPDPMRQGNVERFIAERLAGLVTNDEETDDEEEISDEEVEVFDDEEAVIQDVEGDCLCSRLVGCLEESLECPVCREQAVPGSPLYQCPSGHVLCASCRARLLTCPVCREVLSLPAIRNRALERLASLLYRP